MRTSGFTHQGKISTQACRHCGSPLRKSILASGNLDASASSAGFCCLGCESVFHAIHENGLEAFYILQEGRGAPVGDLSEAPRDTLYLELLQRSIDESPGLIRICLDVQGMHCAGCVFLFQHLFERNGGGEEIRANPLLGRVEMWVQRGFSLAAFVKTLERFGYRVGPAQKGSKSKSRDGRSQKLLLRFGISLALAANAMMFAAAIHFGLREEPLHSLMRTLTFVLATGSFVVAVPEFLPRAFRSLFRGEVHLDLPIAVGMILAFSANGLSFATRGPDYSDTLSVFCTLMLLGRFLTERSLLLQRNRLLDESDSQHLFVRKQDKHGISILPVSAIQSGDELIVHAGEMLLFAGESASDCQVSRDFASGESTPTSLAAGGELEVGSILLSPPLLHLQVTEPFGARTLVDSLGSSSAPGDPNRNLPSSLFYSRVATAYVLVVFALAAACFVLHSQRGDAWDALFATTALLVVTCPCGLGIALPLARDLSMKRLRARGIVLRNESTLEKILEIDHAVFDKTGTLTTSLPRVLRFEGSLDARWMQALACLANASQHPKSRAIATWLSSSLDPANCLDVQGICDFREIAGSGVQARWGRQILSLSAGADGSTDFAVDGSVQARLFFAETIRPNTAKAFRSLRNFGIRTSLLSGDSRAEALRVGRALELSSDQVFAPCSPSDKERFVAKHNRRNLLFVGDGLNDLGAISAAHVSATPCVDRPFVPSRVDVFFLTGGIEPVVSLLEEALLLRKVERRTLASALAYNSVFVALALGFGIPPWLAAVLMPTFSLLSVFQVSRALRVSRVPETLSFNRNSRSRGAPWKFSFSPSS